VANENWVEQTAGPVRAHGQSERLVHAASRLRLICEARRRPLDKQLLERRPGLDDREVVAPGECPILESLTSSAALFDVCIVGSQWHDAIRKALRDYNRSLYQTVRCVLLKPGLKRFVRARRQCWTIERRHQCLNAFLMLGRHEVAQVYDLTRSIERLWPKRLVERDVRVEPALRQG